MLQAVASEKGSFVIFISSDTKQAEFLLEWKHFDQSPNGTFETKNKKFDIHIWKHINFCHTQYDSLLTADNRATHLHYNLQLQKSDVEGQKFMDFQTWILQFSIFVSKVPL